MTDTVLGYVIGLFFNIFLVTLSWSHQEASTRRFQRTSARPSAFNKQYFQIIKREWLQLVLTKWLSFIWNVFFGFDLTQVFLHQYGMITRTDRGANNPWQHYKLMGLVYRSFTGVGLYLNSHLAAGSMKPRFNMDWFFKRYGLVGVLARLWWTPALPSLGRRYSMARYLDLFFSALRYLKFKRCWF